MTTETPASTPVIETPASEPVVDKVPEGYVSKAELEHALADVHKFKAKATELENKGRKEEETRLRETENWKKLAEIKTKDAEEAAEQLNSLKTSLIEDKKYSAVKDAAIKSGIRPEALPDLELLGLRDVVIETTSTGRVNVLGADRFVDQLKTIRPHWFGKPSVNINSSVPGIKGAGPVANETDLIKLSLEAQRTGDYAAYENKLKEYKQRKRGV